MSPLGVEEPNLFDGLKLDTIRRAVEIYLEIAYSAGEPPPAVRRRLNWPPGDDLGQLVSHPPFERMGKTPDNEPIFGLRLGNASYPHMKLQIQPWDVKDGFLLSVNTHDHGLKLDPDAPDAAAFIELQSENQRLKLAIENAWDQNDLPTFPRYLRNYLAKQIDPGPVTLDGEQLA